MCSSAWLLHARVQLLQVAPCSCSISHVFPACHVCSRRRHLVCIGTHSPQVPVIGNVHFGCLSCVGGDNIGNGNQVLDGATSKWGKASSDSISTSGGQANGGTNSITGRRSLLSSGGSGGSSGGPGQKPPSNPAPSNNVACSTGLVAVKFGVGTVCVQQADGKFPRRIASRCICMVHSMHCLQRHLAVHAEPSLTTSWAECTFCSHSMLPASLCSLKLRL